MIINGNALHIPLADGSVQTCVTSPPYYGLRDYGTGRWQGGDPECDHVEREIRTRVNLAKWSAENADGGGHAVPRKIQYRKLCAKCGATRVDKQIGAEQTPEEYVAQMVAVFREVKRVLRDDGTLWLILGDSYYSKPGNGGGISTLTGKPPHLSGNKRVQQHSVLKRKDLIGIPWRVAFALQADGWWLRRDIIWHKTNGMPEQVKDRPTSSHEYVFLLTKRARYYFDNEAVREKYASENEPPRAETFSGIRDQAKVKGVKVQSALPQSRRFTNSGRNIRSVWIWSISNEPSSEDHFAQYPRKLVEPCIKAGTSQEGCCPICGAAWVRIIQKTPPGRHKSERQSVESGRGQNADRSKHAAPGKNETVGWKPGCNHVALPVPCVVLDPFVGSGTTCVVAQTLGRKSVGLDLSFDYLARIARKRLGMDALKQWENGIKDDNVYDDLPLFGG